MSGAGAIGDDPLTGQLSADDVTDGWIYGNHVVTRFNAPFSQRNLIIMHLQSHGILRTCPNTAGHPRAVEPWGISVAPFCPRAAAEIGLSFSPLVSRALGWG